MSGIPKPKFRLHEWAVFVGDDPAYRHLGRGHEYQIVGVFVRAHWLGEDWRYSIAYELHIPEEQGFRRVECAEKELMTGTEHRNAEIERLRLGLDPLGRPAGDRGAQAGVRRQRGRNRPPRPPPAGGGGGRRGRGGRRSLPPCPQRLRGAGGGATGAGTPVGPQSCVG